MWLIDVKAKIPTAQNNMRRTATRDMIFERVFKLLNQVMTTPPKYLRMFANNRNGSAASALRNVSFFQSQKLY
jgi:hypothetical protein